MYARATIAQPQGITVEAFADAVRTHVIPVAQAQEGFKGFLLVLDQDYERVLGITLWESLAALEASETGPYYEEVLKLTVYLPGQFERVTGEVVLHGGFL